MNIEREIQSILEDDFFLAKEDSRHLEKITLKKILELANLYPSYVKQKDSDDSLDFDQLFIEAKTISTQFDRRAANFHLAKQKLLASGKLSAENLAEAEREVLSLDLLGEEISVDAGQTTEKLMEDILQTFYTNAALKADFLEEGAEISIEELEQKNVDPKVVYHLKKTALDQAIVSYLLTPPSSYDSLLHVEVIDEKHKANELVSESDAVQGKKIEVLYFNAARMDRLQFPRFAEFLNSKNGSSTKYLKNVHHEKSFVVPVVIGAKNLKVKVPIWVGQVSGIME